MATETRIARFDPGQLVLTKRALGALTQDDVLDALVRHLAGDWGDLDELDWQQNETAVNDGGRILSSFRTRSGRTFWVITEADRSATTFLLPEDY